jgi:hypothetical protein
MAALSVLSPDAQLEFTRLKGLVGATDGMAHRETLEKAGTSPSRRSSSARNRRRASSRRRPGARAFTEHVAYLREILDGGAPP